MKKTLAILLAVIFLFNLAACGQSNSNSQQQTSQGEGASAPAEQQPAQSGNIKRITFGTAGTAGALYPMGVAMSETITNHANGIAATGEATAASVENLRGLHQGNMGLAISQTEVASFAYYGKLDYEGNAFTDIRALFSTIYNYLQVFAPANSDIQTIADLKGKTVAVGAAGSGGELAARALLEAYGLSYDDVSPQFMPDSEATSALKDGKIAAIIVTHPINSAALTELTSTMDTKLLPIENDEFYTNYSAYTKYTVPAGTYTGIDVDVVIPRSRIIVCGSTNSGLSDDDYYNIVKVIWENCDEWKGSNASVEKQVVLEHALEEIDIPLHPGAIRYFEEIGMEIPDALRQ